MKRTVLLIISIISAAYLVRKQIKKIIYKLLRKYYSFKSTDNNIIIDTKYEILTKNEINDIMEPILYYKNMKSKKIRSKLSTKYWS